MIPRSVLNTLPPYHPGQKKPGTVKLSSNENPRGPSPKAIAAAKRALESVAVYPDGGSTDLRNALASYTGFPAERIIVGNGSDDIMVMVAAAYVDPGDVVVTGAHTFSQYAFAGRLFGGRVIETSMADRRFDVDLLITAGREAKVIFVCSPNNPTGSYLTADELKKVVTETSRETLLVIDQAYLDYVDASDYGATESWLHSRENVMVLRTFSKIYGLAALRVGYGIAAPEVVENLSRVKQPFNINGPAQAAALAALADREFYDETIAIHRSAKSIMENYLTDRGVRYLPTQGNFFCIDLPTPAGEMVLRLVKEGFSVRDLGSFGLPSSIRVTIGTEQQAIGFCDALGRQLNPMPVL